MNFKFFTTLSFFLLFSIHHVFSQDIMDIPPLDSEGNPALANMIAADTSDTGERANPNRIYRLEREGIYVLTSTIIANYPISFIADEDDSKRPPIIVSGKFDDGVNIRPMMKLVGKGNHHSFKNIFFNAVDLDRAYDAEWIRGIEIQADSVSTTFEGCVFNAFTGGATRFDGAHASIVFRDCVWRNGVSPTHMFIGQQITLPALPVESLTITNSTYFNNNSFWIYQENGLVKKFIFEHNTIFTSLIDVIRMRTTSNASIKSNIYYGTHAYGDSQESKTGNWYEPDGTDFSIISYYEVPSAMLEEAGLLELDRKVFLENNVYFAPQPIKDYWAAHSQVSGPEWMNERTIGLFESHPNFKAQNNLDQDPLFADTDMDTWVTGKVADYCTTYRATLTPGSPLSGDAGDNRNYDEYKGVDILSGIAWPLPESMEITDIDLLVGGHDGLPVGNLNWNAEKRVEYHEPNSVNSTGLDDILGENTNLKLIGNFPNPSQGFTNFVFDVKQQGEVTLKIFNLFGQEVIVLVDSKLKEGSYKYGFATSNLSPGNYFYVLSSNGYKQSNILTIVK